MGEVVIRVNSRIIERVVYWILIIALVILLVVTYLDKDCASDEKVTGDEDEDRAGNADDGDGLGDNVIVIDEPPEDDEPEIPDPDETCSDGIKNQDESNVDCGGVCTSVNGGFWYDGDCHEDPEEEEPDLSNTIDFSLKSVTPGDVPDKNKVESISVEVINGKTKNLFGTLKVFVKSTSGIYLNQAGADEYEDITYAEIELPKIESGETYSQKLYLNDYYTSGSYIFEQTGFSPGDDYKVTVELYDDNDEKIDAATKTVKV